MFRFFRKKDNPSSQKQRVSFLEQVIDAVIALPSANDRLIETTKLKLVLEELQQRYSVPCWELDLIRDELSDAFAAATSSKVMLACATDLGFRELKKFPFEVDDRFTEIEEHLKVRLVRLWVDLFLGGLNRHVSEYKIENQAAFYELESRRLSAVEMSFVLCEEYEICDWTSLREMNPSVMFSS